MTSPIDAATPDEARTIRTEMARKARATARKIFDSYDNVDWDKVPVKERTVAIGILIDKAEMLTRDTNDGNLAAVDAFLIRMTTGDK